MVEVEDPDSSESRRSRSEGREKEDEPFISELV
jgi:hypothetical protein